MIRINLMPPRERQPLRFGVPGPEINLGVLCAAVAAAVVLLIGGSAGYLLRQERRLTADVQTAAREVTTLKAIVGPAAKMKDHVAELRARLKVIQTLTKDQGRPLSLVDAFADAVPGDLWVTAFEENGAILRVTGGAYSSTAVSNFMAALRASGKFKDVDIVVSKRDLDKAPNVLTFEVTCRFES
jgi:type IV pilus assembly protein PilN